MKNPQAVLALMVDFSKAFNRQNHNIIVKVLSRMGVPGWLLKLVVAFLTDRELILRYKGKKSGRKSLPGGSPQGTRLGMFLFLILINFAGFEDYEVITYLGAHVIKPLHRRLPLRKKHLKYIDDMTYLTSLNLRTNLAPNMDPNPSHPLAFHDRTGHYLPEENCEILTQIHKLEAFVDDHQMRINHDKTKVMLFNTSTKRDFMPRIPIDGSDENLEVVEQLKLLGILITSNMKWHANTAYLCERGYSRLWMIRNLKKIGATKSELLDVYFKQCRSILELAAPVWTGGLTKEDVVLLERVQKTALAIIIGSDYTGYKDALNSLNVETLEERRVKLCLNFAKKAAKSEKMETLVCEVSQAGAPTC